MSKWLKRGGHGALWLLAATLITKLIGVLQKIPLQNIGGDAVFGIYNMIYPLYQLMLILAVSGIPTAISAIIAEAGNRDRKIILRASSLLMLVIGLGLGLIVYGSANQIAHLLGSSTLTGLIKIIAATICISPIVASYRGYYQGIKLASYSSVSQLIEQVIRVGIMVIILFIGVSQQWTDVALATYVMWGGVAGAVIALFYLMSVKQEQTYQSFHRRNTYSVAHYMRLLLIRGVPAALAAVIVPLIAVIDTFSIPLLLKNVASFNQIAEQFGLYSRIQPLVQLITMLLAAIIAGVLPDLILHNKKKQADELLNLRMAIMLRYTIIIGVAAVIGLTMLAEPISIMLYKNTLGVGWFKLLAFMTLPAAVLAVITPFLLIQRKIILLLMMVSISLTSKLVLNIVLVQSFESMLGAIHATNIALYITAGMAIIAVWERNRQVHLSQAFITVISRSTLALAAMALYLATARYVFEHMLHINVENRIVMTVYVILLVLTGAFVLALLLYKQDVINKQHVKLMISKQ